jgi:hypothetical protein
LPLTYVNQATWRRHQKPSLPIFLLLLFSHGKIVEWPVDQRATQNPVNDVISGVKWRNIISEKWSIFRKCFCFRKMLLF